MYVVVVFFVRGGGGGACAEPKFGDFFSENKNFIRQFARFNM